MSETTKKRITKAERALAGTMADRDLVVACLHYSGAFYDRLPRGADLGARVLCDGFGPLNSAQLDALGVTYDWSHVRDSSEKGFANCAMYLRQVLKVPRVQPKTIMITCQCGKEHNAVKPTYFRHSTLDGQPVKVAICISCGWEWIVRDAS